MVQRRVSLLFTLPLLFAVACAEETIAHKQKEADANSILVYLNRAGIKANKVKDEGRDLVFNVSVSKDESGAALEVLNRYNLPKTPAADLESMFKEGGMIPTPEQQRAKLEIGKRGDIINSLRAVPRVVDVQAVVSLPEDTPLRDPNEPKPRPKASVIIKYLEEGEGGPPLTPEDVQRYVQAAIPEIKSGEVSVMMHPAETPDGKAQGAGGAAVAVGDFSRGCSEKESVFGMEVCAGSKPKLQKLLVGIVVFAGLLSGLMILAVLRAMRYRKDLTRLTAQFERVKAK